MNISSGLYTTYFTITLITKRLSNHPLMHRMARSSRDSTQERPSPGANVEDRRAAVGECGALECIRTESQRAVAAAATGVTCVTCNFCQEREAADHRTCPLTAGQCHTHIRKRTITTALSTTTHSLLSLCTAQFSHFVFSLITSTHDYRT